MSVGVSGSNCGGGGGVETGLTGGEGGVSKWTGGGNGGGGGGYGAGVLMIIAQQIVHDDNNPPKFLASGQKGGTGGSPYGTTPTYTYGENGQNGEGGMLLIQCTTYIPSYAHYNLDSNTYGQHTISSINGGHGIQAGNPQKVFINGYEPYHINVILNANGVINPGSMPVLRGSGNTYNVTPDVGYYILDVIIDGLSNETAKLNASYTFSSVMADHSIEARFAEAFSGTVKDYVSGGPLSTATIAIGGKTAQSDANGHFAIGGLSPGTYDVVFSKMGYRLGL
jgi:hypothetical protein